MIIQVIHRNALRAKINASESIFRGHSINSSNLETKFNTERFRHLRNDFDNFREENHVR